MAGDRGMRFPELTGASLQHLNLPKTCKDGYSTSRTCEMSLSNHAGINFRWVRERGGGGRPGAARSSGQGPA